MVDFWSSERTVSGHFFGSFWGPVGNILLFILYRIFGTTGDFLQKFYKTVYLWGSKVNMPTFDGKKQWRGVTALRLHSDNVLVYNNIILIQNQSHSHFQY